MTQDLPERIAIAGAGVAGAWLSRALADRGRTVDVYEVPDRQTSCGIHPCAWCVSAGFLRRLEEGGMDPDAYVTSRIARIEFEKCRVRGELFLVEKPRLVRALLDGAVVRCTPLPANRYDRILDCTGAARAYLPPTGRRDVLARTVQVLVHAPSLPSDTIRLRCEQRGYCWVFPLGGDLFHVGAMGLLEQGGDVRQMLQAVGFLDDGDRVAGCTAREVCGCESTIRLTGPAGARPHVAGESALGCPVWGVGESIGTVSPLTGEGIVHAVRCADLYLEHEDDPDAYSDAVVREFSWMADERKSIGRVLAGEGFSLADWRVLRQNAAGMGIDVGVSDLLAVLRTLVRERRVHLVPPVSRHRKAR